MFERGSHEEHLEHLLLLRLPFKCWDDRLVSQLPARYHFIFLNLLIIPMFFLHVLEVRSNEGCVFPVYFFSLAAAWRHQDSITNTQPLH